MGIDNSGILNITVDIKKEGSTTRNNLNELVSSGHTLVESDVPARITKNGNYDSDEQKQVGFLQSSTHLMFTAIGVNIKKGYFVYYGSEIYTVNYVDKKPGGKTDSHYQTYMTYNEAMQG